MISILIPVYNTDVVQLVNELSRQLNCLHIEGEIIVFDDHSSSYCEHNRQIGKLDYVTYKELEKNYGRTAIRILLAANARYEWLLYIDSDSRIIRDDFLKCYLNALLQGFDVYVGGTVYQPEPVECTKRLHWKYGMKREAKENDSAFHTNNFCIKKEVFQQLKFPDFLKNYGHEDTWMGMELKNSGKKIRRINNPVEHLNIENTRAFLNKTGHALENLLLLQKVVDSRTISNHVTLFRLYTFIKKMRLGFAVNLLYRFFEKKISQNLNSCHPSLFIFDFYRLHHLILLSKRIIE